MDPQYSSRLDRAARPFYLDRMCGRFTQQLSRAEIHRLADLIGQPRASIQHRAHNGYDRELIIRATEVELLW